MEILTYSKLFVVSIPHNYLLLYHTFHYHDGHHQQCVFKTLRKQKSSSLTCFKLIKKSLNYPDKGKKDSLFFLHSSQILKCLSPSFLNSGSITSGLRTEFRMYPSVRCNLSNILEVSGIPAFSKILIPMLVLLSYLYPTVHYNRVCHSCKI